MKSMPQLKGILLMGFLLLLLANLSPASDLIEPTRTLQSASDATGSLTILSEPPNLDVTLDGTSLGKTPVFLDEVASGIHTLRVQDSETTIDVKPDRALKISLFKGQFIKIPVAEKKAAKQPAAEENKVVEAPTGPKPAKEQRKKDLTPWEKYVDGSLNHF